MECLNYYSPALTALGTVAIAVFTFTLWRSSVRQAQLTREAFLSQHRPKIIVHSFEHSHDEKGQIGATFTYVNAGETEARVLEIATRMFFSENPSPGVQMDARAMNKTLAPGERGTYLVESQTTETQAFIEQSALARGATRNRFVCVGRIVYSDLRGMKRETGFCREYDYASARWRPLANSDYEYAY